MAVKLSDFAGLEVTSSSIEIPNAAGGLRDALKVDPVELHKGDVVYVVLECEVAKVRFDSTDKDQLDGPQERVHVFRATNATLVDKSLVADQLAAQADRVAAAKELEGQQKLATGEPFLGYADLTVDEVLERVDGFDGDDADLVDAIEAYEEANGGRGQILKAITAWRKAGE